MPALIRHLTPAGLESVDYTADSLGEAAAHEPDDGVYTVTRTYRSTATIRLKEHFDRLEDSARRADMPLHLDRAGIRAALRQMIETSGYGDVRFRVTVPRTQPDHAILTIEPFTPPPASLIERGVVGITAADSARDNAAAKTTGWMHARETLKAAQPAGVYETFLLDSDGHILEGLTCNFYAILDGELRTAGSGVLGGISRQIVMAVAPAILPVREVAIHLDELTQCSDAFLTSSSRGIIPVIRMDDVTIADGMPGTQTLQLRQAYDSWVDEHLEEL